MTNVSKKLTCTIAVGLWSMASMALAGQGKAVATGCFEAGAQGKAVTAAKSQEECQKLGEKFMWKDAAVHDHHKGHEHKATKTKDKVKQQAKTEVKPAATTTEAIPAETKAAPTTEAPAK